jgi:TRAP-type C4-dicarboxylate transport system permease small subunit
MRSALDKVSLWVSKATGVVVVFLACVLVASILISIVFRYIVGAALSWPEEISLMDFAWLVLLTGTIGVREGFHVRLVLLQDRLPAGARAALQRLIDLAIGVFGGILVYAGRDLVVRTQENLTPTLRLPTDLVNWSAPVCGALIVLHTLARLANPAREEEESRE